MVVTPFLPNEKSPGNPGRTLRNILLHADHELVPSHFQHRKTRRRDNSITILATVLKLSTPLPQRQHLRV